MRLGYQLIALSVFLACLEFPAFAKEDGFFSGSVSERYRFRSTGSVDDSDMETLFTLDLGQSQNRFSGHLQAGAIVDMDHDPATSPFASIYDTFGNRAVGRFYYGYFNANDLGPILHLRAGRQHRYEFESFYYDGLTVETDPFYGFSLTAYGGTPVHLFENQFGFDPGDWLLGTALDWNPLKNFQFRFDFAHLRDKVSGFRAGVGNLEDNLLGATFWWEIDPRLFLSSRFTSFSDQVRDVNASVQFQLPKIDFSFRFNFYKLLKSIDIRNIDLDPASLAGIYRPYAEFSATATKGFGSHVALDAGWASRILSSDQVANAFNHGFNRVFLSASVFDLPLKNMTLTTTTDYYNGVDNTLKNNSLAFSFSADQKLFEKRLKLSAGTAYYLYRFNLLAGNESQNARSYFLNVGGKIFKTLEAKAGYELEDNQFNAFHTADARLIWSF